MTVEPTAEGAARHWLRRRVDALSHAAAERFLREAAEAVSVASGDACGIRVRSHDGSWLPVVVHHPDPMVQAEMQKVMDHSARVHGLRMWDDATRRGETVAFDVGDDAIRSQADEVQAEFLRSFTVTRVLGAPVVLNDEIVGGVGLARYVDRRPFSDDDRAMLHETAERVAKAIDFGRLGETDPAGVPV